MLLSIEEVFKSWTFFDYTIFRHYRHVDLLIRITFYSMVNGYTNFTLFSGLYWF